MDVDSIETNQADRNGHLKSDDFFGAASYPYIVFKNGILTKQGETTYELKGDLTIKEVTQPVTLDVDLGGVAGDPYGNTKAGFEVTGKINRKEFGLTWDAVTEAGNVVVGEDVKLNMNIQLVKS